MRLEFLGGHIGDVEAVLVHVDVQRLNCPPEGAISEPLRSLDAVGVAGGLVVHHVEHELGDCVPVITHELAYAATLKTFGAPSGLPLTPGVNPFPVTPPRRVVSGLL